MNGTGKWTNSGGRLGLNPPCRGSPDGTLIYARSIPSRKTPVASLFQAKGDDAECQHLALIENPHFDGGLKEDHHAIWWS